MIELDDRHLSIETPLADDAGESDDTTEITYPRINAPVPRPALFAVGVLTNDEDSDWPEVFTLMLEFDLKQAPSRE